MLKKLSRLLWLQSTIPDWWIVTGLKIDKVFPTEHRVLQIKENLYNYPLGTSLVVKNTPLRFAEAFLTD